ncbi:MAG: hypothetical protein IJE59_01995 [Clostridia bacterium]|nr:hypothetical protein [Clostridia bacterium]
MYSNLKKSKITDWWVAEANLKMAFVNILSGQPLDKNLLVVGYLDKENRELGTSTNRVVKVTKEGVITEKGTFYPFKEAHDLYLHFLIEANKENTLIATKWEYADKICKRKIIADIVRDGTIEERVTFDFTPSKKYNVMFAGYSKDLSSNIILTTFARRNVCIKLQIPDVVKSDIHRSSVALHVETLEKIRLVQAIFTEKLE